MAPKRIEHVAIIHKPSLIKIYITKNAALFEAAFLLFINLLQTNYQSIIP